MAEMVYVQRDGSGAVKGVYRNPQPQPDGTCLTEPKPVRDDSPEVVAYLAASSASPVKTIAAQIISDPTQLANLKAAIAK